MTITMLGIPNCDTIKKAKKWLEAEGIEFEFHDYRKQGITEELVTSF
ncbi:arsenate reductase, partial [Vibrio cyclitrophicus]